MKYFKNSPWQLEEIENHKLLNQRALASNLHLPFISCMTSQKEVAFLFFLLYLFKASLVLSFSKSRSNIIDLLGMRKDTRWTCRPIVGGRCMLIPSSLLPLPLHSFLANKVIHYSRDQQFFKNENSDL